MSIRHSASYAVLSKFFLDRSFARFAVPLASVPHRSLARSASRGGCSADHPGTDDPFHLLVGGLARWGILGG
jgi:hypothetical protein